LASYASALLASDPRAGLDLLERARTKGLGRLDVLVGTPRRADDPPVHGATPIAAHVTGDEQAMQLLAGVWLVDVPRLLEARSGIVVTREGHGYDAERGALWFAGEAGEAMLLELDARRRALADEAEELEARLTTATREAEEAGARAAAAEEEYREVAHLRGQSLDADVLRRLAGFAADTAALTTRATEAISRIEAPLNASLVAGARRSSELGEELRRLSEVEAEARRDAVDAGRRAAEAEVELARLGGTPVAASAAAGRTLDELVADAREARAESEAAVEVAQAAADAARAAEAALRERAPRTARLDVDLVRRLVVAADGLGDAVRRAAALAVRFEAPVRARADAGAERALQLGAELRRLGAAEVELRQGLTNASASVSAIDVEVARIEAEADEARRRLEHAGTDERAEGDDREELVERAERLERRRESLGQVNPLAKEEYEAEKARLDELATQRKDLEASLTELEKLRAELTETVERRFAETFDAVQRNFAEVAATLFPGGEGRLELVLPEDEESQPGIEVHLRPAGKKVQRLSLLSGGEKALGAISFLFALFLARPCPFYLLDEVEAALDDTNIGRFVELLRRYSDRAQFVVITHQKRTMEAADILYGVTMGGDGVSQVVSRRLPREEAEAVSAA
ncbi:MAG TPA: AAA family ATPase, partial [Gaiellaceae bacterium]|nr:AAA family ATPase [Gaiellaceae bacterium]